MDQIFRTQGNEPDRTDEDPPNLPTQKPARPGRPRTLSLEQVVNAAMQLADERGLDQLSMPKLADRLSVGTMTLYGYVDGKEDLLDRMAEEIFRGLTVPSDGPWQDRLVEYFRRFRQVALAHPTLSSLLAGGRVYIPEVFATLETIIGGMHDQGVHVHDAVRTFFAGLTYTLGFVIWETPRSRLQPELQYQAQWHSLLDQLDPDQYPLLAGPARQALPTVASDAQFEWGLAAVVHRRSDPHS